MADPYIGITGFTRAIAPELLLAHVRQGAERKFMVGVLVSGATLRGGPSTVPRFPPVDGIADIFPEDSRTLNMIHFNGLGRKSLHAVLRHLAKIGGPNLNGIQLNLHWPEPADIQLFRHTHPDLKLVLQLGSRALRRVDIMDNIPKRLNEYEGLIDYILVDPSGGRGVRFDPERAEIMVRAIVASGFAPVVAGGLCAGTLDPIRRLLKLFPEISWDAEGRLMKEDGELSPRECSRYLSASFAL